MSAARLPVRAGSTDLLVVDLSRFPALWPAYQRGLYQAYSAIGAADLAMGPDLPVGVTKVALAKAPGGDMVGGVLRRERPEIARYTGRADIAAAIAERAPDEIGGCWIHPDWRGGGLATDLVREVLAIGSGRWTVTLANQFSLGVAVGAGFVPDMRFRDFPFPDKRFRSTLCWFDRG